VLAALIAELHRTNGGVATFLQRFEAAGIDGDALVVRTSASGKALYTVADDRVRRLVQEAGRKLFGRALVLREIAAPPSARAAERTAQNPLVERAKRMFDGEEVS
jgi:hypothetical protein